MRFSRFLGLIDSLQLTLPTIYHFPPNGKENRNLAGWSLFHPKISQGIGNIEPWIFSAPPGMVAAPLLQDEGSLMQVFETIRVLWTTWKKEWYDALDVRDYLQAAKNLSARFLGTLYLQRDFLIRYWPFFSLTQMHILKRLGWKKTILKQLQTFPFHFTPIIYYLSLEGPVHSNGMNFFSSSKLE